MLTDGHRRGGVSRGFRDKLPTPLLNHLIYKLSAINEFQDDAEAQFRVKVAIHEKCVEGKRRIDSFTMRAAAYHFIGS